MSGLGKLRKQYLRLSSNASSRVTLLQESRSQTLNKIDLTNQSIGSHDSSSRLPDLTSQLLSEDRHLGENLQSRLDYSPSPSKIKHQRDTSINRIAEHHPILADLSLLDLATLSLDTPDICTRVTGATGVTSPARHLKRQCHPGPQLWSP